MAGEDAPGNAPAPGESEWRVFVFAPKLPELPQLWALLSLDLPCSLDVVSSPCPANPLLVVQAVGLGRSVAASAAANCTAAYRTLQSSPDSAGGRGRSLSDVSAGSDLGPGIDVCLGNDVSPGK